ncbi:MAG: undecaprenyldiphospho-muramoylpentapeptide beta-N-acetylglucosaminyltransferase [Firmicutes bacterium]|nr:undecaprenyldiphospho-muramoylpentapeptide beta-N-acetylglucosaminyltransferase [Bacillota bacterium]
MRVLLTCGGTGGHIYPAISIADKIKEHHPEAEILFIGTRHGMENRLVPAAGYEIEGIDASGLDRRNLAANIKTLENVIKGSREAARIIERFKPDLAIGTGGYVTGSVMTQAHKKKIPCYIHEQNAVPGVTNKLLESRVDKVFISFEQSAQLFRHPEKTVLTGNPVRAAFSALDRKSCREKLGLDDDCRLILLFGGSLGAGILNDAAMELGKSIGDRNIRFIFVTGRRYFEEISARKDFPQLSPSVEVISYADDMPELMTASDLVVSRAGAIAVSEILVCAKPSILVPSPNVTNNHQFKNAKAVADEGAALLIEDKELADDPGLLAEKAFALLADDAALESMRENAARLAKPDAAELIYQDLEI